ncbi:MAG: hypothetical protein AAGB93_03895 [Planctomycetota bacterium]
MAAFESSDDPTVPRYGWFAGVLEGHLGDPDGLRAATASIQALRMVGCDLEIDGGRFSFLFDEKPVPGPRLSVDNQHALVAGLQALVIAAASTAPLESTLRGSLVYPTSVVETLFAVQDGQIQPVSRRRGLEERDRAHAPGMSAGSQVESALGGVDAKRGILLLALVLLAAVGVAWNRGYLDLVGETLFSRSAEEVPSRTGPFGEMLELEVEKSLGKFVCRVRRGPAYPTTADEIDALAANAKTPAARAAANAVGNGGVVGVALMDDQREIVVSGEVRLAALLEDEEAEVEVPLRAKLRGRIIELVLDPTVKGATRR